MWYGLLSNKYSIVIVANKAAKRFRSLCINMAQTLFSRVVSIKLPLAVPTQLSHIDDFEIGKVLILSKRPRRFRPQKNEDLQYTGVSISSLLEESCVKDFEIMSSASVEFITSKEDPLNLNFDLSSKSALTKALTKLQLNIKEAKHATLTADFGQVKCLEANVLYSCSTKELRVKLEDPTIKKAMATSDSLFVITSIYRGERCHLKVSLGGSQKEVLSRDKNTVIAYLLMKLSVDRNGVIKPMVNNGRLNVLVKHSPPKNPDLPSQNETPGDQASDEVDSADLIRDRVWSHESIGDFPGWTFIDKLDQISEEIPEQSEQQVSGATGLSGGAQPVVEEVMVKKVTNLSSIPDHLSPEDNEEVPMNPQLDQRYVYSLKDFQPFESITYDGIHTEVQQWIKPLVSNKKLHSLFLEYVAPPKTPEKLQKLSQFLLDYGKALRHQKPGPANTPAPLEPILSALNVEWGVRLDEVSSVIIVCEALREFPQHIVKKAIQLPAEKRTTLVDFVRSTPYGGDKHVYIDEGPFRDLDLNPFMTRMGFSIPPPSNKLVLDLSHEENEDRLSAGMILLLSTQEQ
ncbi:uncharacterized protein LOC135341496 [Halichondria panicea]|uniref:uncharacterized protein LOC135341496 n=1 Tax=Halichondria panicea TaxID=6063 RepID=UPI00312BAF61